MKRFILWTLAVFGLLALLLVGTVSIVGWQGRRIPAHALVHIRLQGELREVPDPDLLALLEGRPSPTLMTVLEAIGRAATDERVDGVVLELRDPVLGLAQLFEIEAAMAKLRAAGKRSWAYLDTAGEFSKGDLTYALAVTADRVVLSPPGDVNLVGLSSQIPFVAETLTRLRLPLHVGKRHEYKNAADTFTETAMSPAQREATVALVDDLQAQLVAHLAARRKVEPSVVEGWLRDGPHLGAQAAERGLVDELRYWDELVAEWKKEHDDDERLVTLGRYAAVDDLWDDGAEVALIVGAGSVVRDGADPGEEIGAYQLGEAFAAAREAEVEAVLFRVNSPGGSYVASDLIRREVEATRAAGIPVVVWMGDVAASGGYFVAMNADRIVAQPATITGSIGVFVIKPATRQFWQHWLGVRFDGYRGAPRADFFATLDLPDPADQARIDAFLDRIYDDFVGKAAAGRGLPREAVAAVAKGRVWTGNAAREAKLVDELGGLDAALAAVRAAAELDADAELQLIPFPKPKSPLAQLLELGGQGVALADRLAALTRLEAELGAQGPLSTPPGWQVH